MVDEKIKIFTDEDFNKIPKTKHLLSNKSWALKSRLPKSRVVCFRKDLCTESNKSVVSYVGDLQVDTWGSRLNSAVFGSPANRTIGKTALIGDWFSTKIAILDFWISKVPFFANFYERSISKPSGGQIFVIVQKRAIAIQNEYSIEKKHCSHCFYTIMNIKKWTFLHS